MKTITLIGENLREKVIFREYEFDKNLIQMEIIEGNQHNYIYFKKSHFIKKLLLNNYYNSGYTKAKKGLNKIKNMIYLK